MKARGAYVCDFVFAHANDWAESSVTANGTLTKSARRIALLLATLSPISCAGKSDYLARVASSAIQRDCDTFCIGPRTHKICMSAILPLPTRTASIQKPAVRVICIAAKATAFPQLFPMLPICCVRPPDEGAICRDATFFSPYSFDVA